MGNLYLNQLDTYVKQVLGVRDYIRYCDDFLLFHDDKKQLGEWAEAVQHFCAERLKLRLSKCDVFPTSHGVDVLGYRHFRGGYISAELLADAYNMLGCPGLVVSLEHELAAGNESSSSLITWRMRSC